MSVPTNNYAQEPTTETLEDGSNQIPTETFNMGNMPNIRKPETNQEASCTQLATAS